VRRINRREYDSIIEDVFGVKVKASEIFPTDDSHNGYDHLAEGLSLSPLWMERLMMAAERVLKLVFFGDDSSRYQNVKYDRFTGGVQYTDPGFDGQYLSTNGELKTKVELKEGDYKLEFGLCGDQAGDEPVKVELIINGKLEKLVEVKVDRDQTEKHVLLIHLANGTHEIATRFINDFWNPELQERKDRNFGLRHLLIENVPNDSERPIYFKKLFANIPIDLKEEDQIKIVLQRVCEKLYRRPLFSEEQEELMKIYHLALNEGEDSDGSLAWALKRALVSPAFVFLTSNPEANAKPDDLNAVPIDEFSLATRLSLFLWGTTPNQNLLNLSKKVELRKNWDSVIDDMLKSPRAYHLTDKFASQWLELGALSYSRPDEKVFKDFNNNLKGLFKRETLSFFDYILKENRSISEFLNADYTIANSKLAEFYGLPKQQSSDRFVKITFDQPYRGGLLGQGSILMMTSFNTRTSAVLRGKWLMEKIMGLPPAPPPQDVPELNAVKKQIANKQLTLREQLEIHRSKKECMSCHSRMDPLGFAMENFNGIGQWRDHDEQGLPIDAAGELISGEKFNNFKEMKEILIKSYQPAFKRVLTESLLKFALGRGLTPQDRPTVRLITQQLEKDDHIHTLIKAIASSRAFQTMRLNQKVTL